MSLLLLFGGGSSNPIPVYGVTTKGGLPALRTTGGKPSVQTTGGLPGISTRGPA